jgi:DNA-binding NtrC family response regulator
MMHIEGKENMKVLVIEDEATALTLYTNVLSREGYDLTLAKTGAEAITQINGKTFDLIILDLELPDVYGMDILKRVRERADLIPVVIITGHPSLDSSIAAIRDGRVYEYLVKPFGHQQLSIAIKHVIDKARLAAENQRLLKKLERANQALTERVDELEKFAQVAVDYEKKIFELKEKIRVLEARLGIR